MLLAFSGSKNARMREVGKKGRVKNRRKKQKVRILRNRLSANIYSLLNVPHKIIPEFFGGAAFLKDLAPTQFLWV